MKYSLLKKQFTFFLSLFFIALFSQNGFKLPENTVFYMEINGKTLNNKINWEKFNPILQEVNKDKNKKNTWTDYSQTGIKYDVTQYHYATLNDSVKSYTAHFILNDPQKFLDFINSSKKEGLEVTKKDQYSYINLDNNTFVAWDNQHAVLKMVEYSKPFQWNESEADSVVAVVDSVALKIDSIAASPEIAEAERPFDYKEEIKYLEEDLEYYQQSIKESKTEIERIKKDIQYLKKYQRYPAKPEEENNKETPNSEEEEEEYPIVEDDGKFQKRMDSINIENFKINKNLAEQSFDEIFKTNFQLQVPKEMLSFRDIKADVFAYADYGNIYQTIRMSNGIPGSFYRIQEFLGKMYNSDSAYNLYFDDDKIRLVNNYRNKNAKVQESIGEFYKGKKNRKIAKLLSDKNIGYYSFSLNGYKSFDMMYDLFENAGDEKYQKEISLIAETMKIALDEKAISKIAPGNGIFILNKLGSKKVDYTDYEYDEDYNSKEVKKTKDVAVPDFTFAFATDNDGFWKRVFDMLASNKEVGKNITKNGELYSFRSEKNSEIDNLFFTVQDGIVYITTSVENIGEKKQSENTKKWAKEISSHSLSGRLDIQKLIVGLEKEFTTVKDKEMFNFFRKNIGILKYQTDSGKESIKTELHYQIDSKSENSLMYFFDLIDGLYKINSPVTVF